MLDINTNVINGVIVIRLEGNLDNKNINNLEEKIDYLIYKQEIHNFIFDFNCIEEVDIRIINNIYNKLIEIFLTCGRVVLCEINDLFKRVTDKGDRIIYVNQFIDAFKYFSF